MREATLGYSYNTGTIHADGESWTFDHAAVMSNQGMVDWYCKRVGLTREEADRVKALTVVQELGAFFLRYKVVAERFAKARYYVLQDSESFSRFSPKALAKIKDYLKDGEKHDMFLTLDFPIEIAIDRAQCLLWYIVNHKGNVPDGFVMDERVSKKARTPIADLTDIDMFVIGSFLKTATVLEKESEYLRDPPVTFGVF